MEDSPLLSPGYNSWYPDVSDTLYTGQLCTKSQTELDRRPQYSSDLFKLVRLTFHPGSILFIN